MLCMVCAVCVVGCVVLVVSCLLCVRAGVEVCVLRSCCDCVCCVRIVGLWFGRSRVRVCVVCSVAVSFLCLWCVLMCVDVRLIGFVRSWCCVDSIRCVCV